MIYFFVEDIRNAILAANEASSATAQVAFLPKGIAGEDYFAEMRAYRNGYCAALATVALAFGLSPATIASSGEQQAWQVAKKQQSPIEAISPHIDIYDEHGTLLVERTPTGLGT